ncbi:Fic/DOC family N-terminal domain-containing protein [Acetobacteraceae bacterium ESL0709]|nr:Fic/DOC family N-terminal domain-containing protein [Acetobacteraceae bacterium ESL0697]MDF7678715.1 Fic/DOC family N-terminal domain-containing protein [Acetobacteraceae bacterium ESL0709]
MTKQPCLPDLLPLETLNWRELLPLAGKANAALARYDGMLRTLPNPAVLLSPMTTKEAVLSSRIEGTQATFDEVLEYDAGMEGDESRRGDWVEISNYRSAIRIVTGELGRRELSLSLIKEAHQRLLQGARGQYKDPGSFRTEQNWIGKAGDRIESARFIPPSPIIMHDRLENWEKYINLSSEDSVLQTLIAHAQFEIIHPFKDGNGRIGRMLIPLILHKNGLISSPVFYLSEYLEEHRDEYYDRLLSITETRDWHGWLVFSINALISQAERNLDKTKKLRALYEIMTERFVDITHSQFVYGAVDAFFKYPIIDGSKFANEAKFNNKMTANLFLKQIEEAGLIGKVRNSKGRKPAIYAMKSLIAIVEGKI